MDSDYDRVLGQAESTLDAVDAALGRLADGSYGTCLTCGGVIPDDRLAAAPTSISCGLHAQ